MTAAGVAPSRKVEPVQGPIEKLKLLNNRKIYYSDKYIFLDHKEFTIVWHNVFLFILLHYYYLKALYGLYNFDPEFVKSAPICKFSHQVWITNCLDSVFPSRYASNPPVPQFFSSPLLSLEWFWSYGWRTSSVRSSKVGLSSIFKLTKKKLESIWFVNHFYSTATRPNFLCVSSSSLAI